MTGLQPAHKHDHAEAMDAMYRYQRHIYDLSRKYYLFGRDRLIDGLNVPAGGTVLEAACGTGRNLKRVARHYPDAKLYGFDISREMLTSARAAFAGHVPPPVFAAVDATRFQPSDFGVAGFDRIMISYALSMIPDWQTAVRAAASALNEGGELHIVDFGQQENLPRWFKSGLQAWLSKFHVYPRQDMNDVLRLIAGECGTTLQFSKIGYGYAWLAVIRR